MEKRAWSKKLQPLTTVPKKKQPVVKPPYIEKKDYEILFPDEFTAKNENNAVANTSRDFMAKSSYSKENTSLMYSLTKGVGSPEKWIVRAGGAHLEMQDKFKVR